MVSGQLWSVYVIDTLLQVVRTVRYYVTLIRYFVASVYKLLDKMLKSCNQKMLMNVVTRKC